jgi:hypothetical protein
MADTPVEILPAKTDADELVEEEPLPGRRRRRHKRKAKEEILDEELSERVALGEILAKGERSDELIRLIIKGDRSLQYSQRAFIGQLMDDNRTLLDKVVALADECLKMTGLAAEARTKQAEAEASAAGGSKLKEAVEVAGLVMQMPLFASLSEILVDEVRALKARREKQRKLLEAKEAKNGKGE